MIQNQVQNFFWEVRHLCSFYQESLRTWIITIVNKYAISNHTALILGVHVLRSYLKPICEYELHSLTNKKVSGAKDDGKNYIKVRPALVRDLLRNCLFYWFLWGFKSQSNKLILTLRPAGFSPNALTSGIQHIPKYG